MNSDLRRSKRFNDFIPVTVAAQNGVNGTRVAGPFGGRIINLSRNGACLLMSLGMLDAYSVYCSTARNPSSFLEIQGSVAFENEPFRLSARPVWTDPFIMDGLRAFKMGVDFLVNPEGEQMNILIEQISAK